MEAVILMQKVPACSYALLILLSKSPSGSSLVRQQTSKAPVTIRKVASVM